MRIPTVRPRCAQNRSSRGEAEAAYRDAVELALEHIDGKMGALDVEVISDFLARTNEYAHHLEAYPRHDNTMLFGCLDELFQRLAVGDSRPIRLTAPAMGKWCDGEEDAPLSE